jgi:hypothetical protein
VRICFSSFALYRQALAPDGVLALHVSMTVLR